MKLLPWPLALVLLVSRPSVYADEDAQADSSLFWGTYRPNLYFGLRPRLPQSLMTGLMWHGLNDFQSFARKFRRIGWLREYSLILDYLQKRVTRVSKETSCKDILGQSTTCAMEACKSSMIRRIIFRLLLSG